MQKIVLTSFGRNLGHKAPSFKNLTLHIDGGVAVVALSRIEKKNAFSWEMYEDLTYLINTAAKEDGIKVLLLSGSGNFYSSGNDITNFRGYNISKTSFLFCRMAQKFVDSFINFPKPLVVAINGPAIGIAVTTLALCDKVYCVPNAYFHTPFVEVGVTPEGCSTFTFPKIMGEKLANEVLWKGKRLSSSDALAIGLVHEVVKSESLLPVALAYCKQLAALPLHSEELRKTLPRNNETLQKLQDVNKEEWEILQNKLVSYQTLGFLSNYFFLRKLYLNAIYMRYDHFLRRENNQYERTFPRSIFLNIRFAQIYVGVLGKRT